MTMQDIEQLGGELLAAVAASGTAEALEAARVAALGRKGALTGALRDLQSLGAAARKARAQALNQLKDRVTDAIAARKAEIDASLLDARLKAERLDVTLPARPGNDGRIHPVSQVMDELVEIFAAMGFRVAEGPDIEDDFHNFTALNMPPDHPARQDFDTFYLRTAPSEGAGPQGGPGYLRERATPPPGGGSPANAGERKLLRTHTSPVQIRAMRAAKPPHRIIVPGRTYRRDSDQTHTPMFHQIEGLVIDRDVHMGHLKGVLHDFCAAFFEVKNLRMRFRPSYFPFTEPSAEVDIGCTRKGGEIRVGAGDDWLEILGCGMVNRRVLEHCAVDADEWQGFAWGLGIDRMAMLKYGIADLRAFFDGDLAWLRHYGFAALDVPALGQGLSR